MIILRHFKKMHCATFFMRRLLIAACMLFSLGTSDLAYALTQTDSPSTCITGGGSGQAWSRPDRAVSSDNAYAIANDDDTTTEQLKCTGYGFSIPAGAIINGITVNIERRASGGDSRDNQVSLLKANAVVGDNKASSTYYPSADQVATYGNSSDLWGTGWTPAEINSAQFGVALRTQRRDDDTVRVDYIGIVVDYMLDTVSPSVISITRAGVNPTSADSVSWNVVFSEAVTGVSAANFSLLPSGLGGALAITSVVGSGANWTVTATTGTGAGTLGLNMSSASGVADLSGNVLSGVPVTGEVYDIDPTAPSQCFGDDFNRANGHPGNNWFVGNEGGSFGNPAIVSNRLRLTNASTQVSTYATLQRIFPGAGNKIVIEFLQYSYGGSGADGMAIVLSDASHAPVAGAFGGSLGYGPKQQAAPFNGDTTHEGFAGGWLGVALDEFGNYSNNGEGRTGGNAPGVTPDAVAIRGSGSGYTGYAYLAGTGTLSPGVDNAGSSTAAPGHKYRITVDHSDNVHAWTSVERDVTGTGSNYSAIVPVFDAKAAVGQAAVPSNWSLSYTGSTGGSANIHEIDSLQVCSITQRALTLHHIQIEHPGTTCGPAKIVVKACADADCTALFGGTVTVSLSRTPTTNSTFPASVTFTGGQTEVTLTKTNTGSVTIGGAATTPTTTNPTRYFNGSTETNVLNFAAACFEAVEVGKGPVTPIYTKLAGVPFTLDVLATNNAGAINTGYNSPVSVALVNPDAASGNCSDTNAGLLAVANQSLVNGRKTFSFTYPQAAKNIKVRVMPAAGGTPTCSKDNFAIRPQQFILSTTESLDPTANNFAAGSLFSINADPGVASGYVGTPILNLTNISANPASSDIPLVGTFPPATGSTSTNTFRYHDAGTITFNQDAVADALFTAVDKVTGVVNGVEHGTTQDCVLGSSSNALVGGRYGCVIGSVAKGPIGRFRPHHYDVSATLQAACGDKFTYMGQPALGVQISLQAMSETDVQLVRYGTGYSPLSTFSIVGNDAGAAISRTGSYLTSTSSGAPVLPKPDGPGWNSGAYSIDENNYNFARAATPDGSYENFALRTTITDPDGVLITSLNGTPLSVPVASVLSETTALRFGRLKLANVNGSGLMNVPVQVRAEYWKNGTGFVTNTDDNCTVIAADAIKLQNQLLGLNTTNMPATNFDSTSSLSLIAGQSSIIVKKPLSAPTAKGSVDVCVDLASDNTPGTVCTATSANMPWLQGKWNGTLYDDDPGARVTLGVFRSGPVIYMREIY